MKIIPIKSKSNMLFFALIFLISCSSQKHESTQTLSNSTATEIKIKTNRTPKIDSVLQFSVMITAMLEDSKGNFWFGSHGDGLCRFDGKKYTYFTVETGLPMGSVREFAPGPDWDKLKKINGGNQIISIQEDEAENIWFKNGENVICKFDGQTFTTVAPEQESTLSTTNSATEWESQLNHLWFGTWEQLGLYRYDGNQLHYVKFPPPYNAIRDGISEIYKDNDGNIWFGTMENAAFRYDGKSLTRIMDKEELGICRVVFQDDSGRVWIGNNRFGLYYMGGDSLTNFTKEYATNPLNKFPIEDILSGAQTIEQAKNGDLWVGTFSDGLWRYDGKKLTHYTSDNGLPIVTVKTIYKDKSGELWFGMGEGTVYGFDGQSFYRFDS